MKKEPKNLENGLELKPSTQHSIIMNYLQQPEPGFLTSYDAYKLGITQFGTRIGELQKKGVVFVKTWVKEPGKKVYKRYSLPIFEPKQEELFKPNSQ